MKNVVNALGRFSTMFASLYVAGNVAAEDLKIAQEAIDRAAMKLAEKHGVDYASLINADLRNSDEYPTIEDLNELMAVNLRRD